MRVLHSVGYMHRAGVETLIMNYYRQLNRREIQFDFLCNKPFAGDYDSEIEALGGHIFRCPDNIDPGSTEYQRFCRNIFNEQPEIKILHAHNGAKQYYALKAARDAAIKVRISHAHGTDVIHDERYGYRMNLIKQIPNVATSFFACGEKAGEFFFGENRWKAEGILIKNAIETKKFSYDIVVRNELRKIYGLTDKFVVGHIGRLSVQKNQIRLLDIFGKILESEQTAVLILVGRGNIEREIKIKAASMGIVDKVFFFGEQENTSQFYQIMDVFLMPSIFEGLPVTGIEAQTSGLPCVFSDVVSKEIALTDNVKFVALGEPDSVWAKTALEFKEKVRLDNAAIITAAGYDVVTEVRKLERIYNYMLI